MEKSSEGIKPEDIIEIISRRRWWIIIPFCLTMIVGICLSFMLPKYYKAETLILIQPQKLPDNYVQSVVTTDVDARLNAFSRQILSRSNLEKIIKDFNLFPAPKYQTMFMEDKIADLQKRISINLIRQQVSKYAAGNAYAFTISFEGKDPEKVMKITNNLASYFIDQNMMFREAEAIGTSNFLEGELSSTRKELMANEKKQKEYREKYMGELPEQLNSNRGMLIRIQEQLKEKQASLLNEENKLAMIMNQISEGAFLFGQGATVTSDGRIVSDIEQSISLEQAKEMLSYLESRYTQKHPDIMRMKKIISDLEQKNKKNGEDTSGKSQYIPPNAKMEVERIKVNINTLTTGISKLKSQIRGYEEQINNTPAREQELSSLKRDYDNIKASYQFLLNRKLESEVSVNMEKVQKGEKFRVLDFAMLPEKPSFPNMKILFLLCLVAGPNIGLGLVFLLEYLNTSFRNPKDIESYLGVPILATVPVIYDRKDKMRQKRNQVFCIFSIMFSCVLLSAFAVLSFVGVEQTMDLLNRFITTT